MLAVVDIWPILWKILWSLFLYILGLRVFRVSGFRPIRMLGISAGIGLRVFSGCQGVGQHECLGLSPPEPTLLDDFPLMFISFWICGQFWEEIGVTFVHR